LCPHCLLFGLILSLLLAVAHCTIRLFVGRNIMFRIGRLYERGLATTACRIA
jgi:hypothetical protein